MAYLSEIKFKHNKDLTQILSTLKENIYLKSQANILFLSQLCAAVIIASNSNPS